MAEHTYDQVMTALRNADAAGDTEAATRLASIAKGMSQPTETPAEPQTNYLQDFAKGAVGTGGAVLDLAAGLPKTLGATIAAPIMTAINGDPEGQRKKAQDYAENLIGTPSKGLAQMGVPDEYLNNRGSQALMYPFEKLSQGIEYLGDKASELTGSKDVGGVVKQAADIGILAAPIPGVKSFKNRFMKEAGPDFSAKAKINPLDDAKLQEQVAAETKGKDFRRQAAEQHVAEQAKQDHQFSQQGELDLGQPNQYGHRPSEFTIDENGIPIRRDASLEAQETVRQGDLFSRDNQATELRNDVLNNAEAGTEGIPGSRDYLRKQEEELAYQQKAKQDSLLPEESVVEPSQRSVEMDNPTRPSPNRGKFGQGGAVNTGFSEAVVDVTRATIEAVSKGLSGIKLTPALSRFLSSGEFSHYWDDFKSDANLKWHEQPQFKVEDGKLTFHTQDAPTVEKFVNWLSETPSGERAPLPPKLRQGANPLGQTKAGKGQGGAIDPDVFLKDFPEFVNSAVKDTAGKLKEVYHATKNLFDEFDTSKTRNGSIYLSTKKATIEPYGNAEGGHVKPSYVNLKNPAPYKLYEEVRHDVGTRNVVTKLKEMGFDGVAEDKNSGFLMAFYPDQVKSSLSPVGQTKFGKGQRGSVNVGDILDGLESVFDRVKPKTLPEFIAAAKQAGHDTSNAVYETMFKGKQEELTASQQVQQARGISAFGKKVAPTLDRYLSPWKDRTSEEVVDIINKLPDNTEKSLGLTSNTVLSKGRLGVQRHANEGIQAGVAYMSQLHENAKIEGNQLLNNAKNGINAVARKLESLVGHGEAYEVYKQIFEHQLDSENHQFQLNPRQQELLSAIKNATDKIWDDFVAQVKNLSPEKAERLAKMKQDYYVPHQFFGDFVSYVRDADGKLVSFIAERTRAGAEAAAQHLRDNLGGEYKIENPVFVGEKSKQLGKKAEAARTGASIQEGLAGQFDYMIDLLGSDDPAVQKAQQAVQRVINRRALTSEGMSSRSKVNTNVGGFQGNKGWKSERENYFDAKDSLERYVNSFYDWKGNMQVADFLNQVKDGAPEKVNTYSTLKNEFERTNGTPTATNAFVTDLQNTFAKTGFSPKELSTGARGLANMLTLQQLGFYNPVMIFQNFVQSPITQVVQMSNLYGHGANFNPAKAFGNILASTWDGMTMGKSNPKWAEYAREHEIGDPGLVTSHGKTKLGSAVKEYGASKPITASEQVSRIGYFYGMTKNLMELGMPEAKALETAKNMTRDHMGNYENYAKPGAMTQMGIAGELAGRLQTYGVNAFTQFAQATADMAKGIKDLNPRLLVPFAAFVATQYLVGGMNGTIPMDVAEKLHWASAKIGVIPPDWRSPRQVMLEDYPKAAVSPLSRATGVWTEGSFRAQVPLLSAPIPQKAVEMVKETPEALKWVMDTYENKNRVSNLDKAQVMEAFLPTSVRGAIEKSQLVNSSGVMVSKGTGRPMYKMGKHDQGIGSLTNLRSYERGHTSELTNLANEREMRVGTARKDLEKSFNEKLSGVVGHGDKLSKTYVEDTIKKDFSLGGDPDKTIERAIKFATEAGYPNQLVLGIINSEKNAFKMQRLARSYKALQENTR